MDVVVYGPRDCQPDARLLEDIHASAMHYDVHRASWLQAIQQVRAVNPARSLPGRKRLLGELDWRKRLLAGFQVHARPLSTSDLHRHPHLDDTDYQQLVDLAAVGSRLVQQCWLASSSDEHHWAVQPYS